jgi:hypothetical protein
MSIPLNRTDKKLSLYKALDIGYLRNENKQSRKLKKFGYVLDKDLTTNERLVAYNPTINKTIFISNGSEINPFKSPTQFGKDWWNNIGRIGTGTFKSSGRYQQEKQAYEDAIKKYNAPVVLAGHSQSGNTISGIAKSNHQAYTLNPALINQKPRENVHNFRIKGDLVSAVSNDVTNLENPSNSFFDIPIVQPHNIDNIKRVPIFL